jgi:hypothetical protein
LNSDDRGKLVGNTTPKTNVLFGYYLKKVIYLYFTVKVFHNMKSLDKIFEQNKGKQFEFQRIRKI